MATKQQRRKSAARKGAETNAAPDPNAISYPDAIEQQCTAWATARGRPLLVLYYPPNAGMVEKDVRDCYAAFRNGGLLKESPVAECDVLLHTHGGDPVAGYRIAQCIRDFATKVSFLVPSHAYSAGTLLCFSGDEIRLGHCAGLSPIDLTMVEQDDTGRLEVNLASIDYYLHFAGDCQRHLQVILNRMDVDGVARVGSDLLCALVTEVGALKVGHYYRARTLTAHYAAELLDSYMLRSNPSKKGIRERIISELLFSKPVHEFHIDFHLCKSTGLIVQEMGSVEFDATAGIVELLKGGVQRQVICPFVRDGDRQPFIAYYTPKKAHL